MLPESTPLFEARHLGLHYESAGSEPIEALRDVSYSVASGEFLSFIGPSGCGKTTLLKLMSGLVAPLSGEILFKGRRISGPPPGIGMAFQDALLLPWRNVVNNVLLPIEIVRRPTSADRDKARDLLASVGLEGFETSASWQLSGGMRQRVSLCRALVHDPEVLLLDEPFAALDAFTREDMWGVLQKLRLKTRCTMVLITHQLNETVFLSDRILVLSRRPGRIVYEETIDAPLPRPAGYAYTPEFIAHVDTIRRRIEH
jgi:NitT/TauT family transport system ATP-binding protein